MKLRTEMEFAIVKLMEDYEKKGLSPKEAMEGANFAVGRYAVNLLDRPAPDPPSEEKRTK